MVREEIVFGQKVSAKGITIDESKIEAIQKLPCPLDVKSLKNFLGKQREAPEEIRGREERDREIKMRRR